MNSIIRAMNRKVIIGFRVLGTGWLSVAALMSAVLAAIGAPHGPYPEAIEFGLLSMLCLTGAIILWQSAHLHWLSATALACSLLGAVYGWVM